MKGTQHADKNVTNGEDTDDGRDAFGARQLRALEEYLTVMPDAVEGAGMVKVVSQSEEEYVVDAVEERCTCPDFEHRDGDENGRCKHIYRARYATGREPIPAALLEECEVEANFGVFVQDSTVRVAATDGGVLEADADDSHDDTDENEECEECAGLSGLSCFECYMAERGFEV